MAKRSNSLSRVRISIKKEIRDQEAEELKKTVRFLETYIVKYSEDCQMMGEKLQTAEESYKELEEKLKSEMITNSELSQKIQELKNEISLVELRKKQDAEAFKKKDQESQAVKKNLEKELLRIQEILKMAAEEVSESVRNRHIIKQKLANLLNLAQIPKKYLHEVFDSEKKLSKLSQIFGQIPKILTENSRLSEENQHLFERLEKSSPHTNFKDLVKDSNGLSYFRNKNNCGKPNCSSNLQNISDWIPKPMHSALEEFKSSHDPIIVTAVVSLFSKLNQVWQSREKNRIERMKKKFEIEIQKRKSPSTTPSVKKSRKSHTRNFSIEKVRENIAAEYKIVTEQMIKLVTEFLEVTDRNFNVDKSFNWLIESLLTILAEFTDKIFSLL